MNLKVKTAKTGGVVYLEVTGPLSVSNAKKFHHLVRQTSLDQDSVRFVIDLFNVSYVDSSGIGELISAREFFAKEGGTLKLSRVTQFVQDRLALVNELKNFEIFDSEFKAVESFDESKIGA